MCCAVQVLLVGVLQSHVILWFFELVLQVGGVSSSASLSVDRVSHGALTELFVETQNCLIAVTFSHSFLLVIYRVLFVVFMGSAFDDVRRPRFAKSLHRFIRIKAVHLH